MIRKNDTVGAAYVDRQTNNETNVHKSDQPDQDDDASVRDRPKNGDDAALPMG
jgi:hypothetical protein